MFLQKLFDIKRYIMQYQQFHCRQMYRKSYEDDLCSFKWNYIIFNAPIELQFVIFIKKFKKVYYLVEKLIYKIFTLLFLY